jgi:CrcB protein
VLLALGVAAAAGVGAALRYVVDQSVQGAHIRDFPFGTLVVNATGSLLLGVVTGLSLHHGLPETPTVVLSAGLAGGYTTLSTWAWESIALAENGALGQALANALGTVALCLVTAGIGLGLSSL